MPKTTPEYLHLSTVDDVATMITALTEELWILRDRVMVLESELGQRGVVTSAELDVVEPGEELTEALGVERRRLIHRVLGAPVAFEG